MGKFIRDESVIRNIILIFGRCINGLLGQPLTTNGFELYTPHFKNVCETTILTLLSINKELVKNNF
jgi:hypothetical protein